jgi:hypothetical protein
MQRTLFSNSSTVSPLERRALLSMAKARTLLCATSRVVPIARLKAMILGGLMTEQQRQQPLTSSSTRDIEPTRDLRSEPSAKWKRNNSDQGLLEREYEAHVRILQQYICELLIKNQRLRWLLQSATNHRCEDFTNDYNQKVSRD